MGGVGRIACLGALVATLLAGCASMSSVGERYARRGAAELAVCYFAGAWRLEPTPETKGQLVRAIKAATRRLDMRYAGAVEQKKYREALGYATRKEELYLFAQRAGLEGFMPEAAGRDAQRVARQSAREALRKLDASTGAKTRDTEMLRLAREALALNPDDPDLTSRYETMRQRLERKVVVKIQGPPQARDETLRAAGRILGVLTEARRELFVVVPEAGGKADMELRVAVELSHGDTGWRQTASGKAKGKVQRRNKYDEIVRNEKGEPVMKPVTAFWRTFERTRHLEVSLSVWLIDLRAGKTVYSRRVTASPRQTRRYYTYTGDDRALRGLAALLVTRLGLDQRPPDPAWSMLAAALPGLTTQHAAALLDKLEYRR